MDHVHLGEEGGGYGLNQSFKLIPLLWVHVNADHVSAVGDTDEEVASLGV
jgi:hypothetical protein